MFYYNNITACDTNFVYSKQPNKHLESAIRAWSTAFQNVYACNYSHMPLSLILINKHFDIDLDNYDFEVILTSFSRLITEKQLI